MDAPSDEKAQPAAGSASSISLPKGGGAIRGIGEKFAANPVTGTGAMTVPLATSPGRSGFGPQLSLSYDSGGGNGPFGIGWNLSLPAITRKTDKGLPQYRDAEESDVFLLSGSEDLVSVLETQNGALVRQSVERTAAGESYVVHRYRPRIEGLFARIERWTRKQDGDTHWRSISKDNVTTFYGKGGESRIADPQDPLRVFSWLICESYDDKGNAIVYDYVAEDAARVDLAQAHEHNRSATGRSASRYLKRIRYGNTPSLLIQPALSQLAWLFEVVFDYGEGHYQALPPDAQGREFVEASSAASQPWPVRQDPFSSYRSGFEVRTYRLCRRVLMFHHFPDELGVPDCLVRATEFSYRETPIAPCITSVTQSGCRRQSDGAYLKKSLPSLDFDYSEATVQEGVREVDPESLANLPASIDGGRYQWLDLDGEGLQCVLAEQDDGWYYKRNLSPSTFTSEAGRPVASARFEPIVEVASLPSFAQSVMPRHQFLDLAGDGQLDCVVLERPLAGFFERNGDQRWETFTPLPSLPNVDWSDPNLRFLDLDGDGHADILITEHEALTWYPSLAERGFGPAIRIAKPKNEDDGPAIVFADADQAVFLADMSGDGLTDIVRIRNGEVCYWPNLGYGHFGRKVTMDRAPWFEPQDLFDQRRIRLADIDGSGVTDIIYLARDGARLYFNQSGNRWSEPRTLSAFPRIDDLSHVQALDLLGNGTACLVWMSSLPGDARHSMRYIDLMGGEKPHLLIRSRNNLGAETRAFYAPSTKFYLADRAAGQPWVTRLPFPVHVVERVESYDWVSRNRFVTRYAYHHGFYDGLERDFRGFGMVEQWDTEEFAAVSTSDDSPEGDNIEAASHVPPVHTKTWFHTGVFFDRNRISKFFSGLLNATDRGEYYREPPGLDEAQAEALLLEDTVLPGGLSAEEEREACRALKGAMLRQEVYALDGTVKAEHPYTVTEQNFTIRLLQPQGQNPHAVFFSHPREAISYHYERNPADPRIDHALTLQVDAFGNVRRALAVGYGRRQPDPALPSQAERDKQTATLITYTEDDVTNAIDDPINDPDNYRTPWPSATRTYELTGFEPADDAKHFSFDEWIENDFALLKEAIEIRYGETADLSEKQKRLIEHVRTLYRRNDLTGLLSLGTVESLALPGESYKLAFTPELARRIYVDSGKLTPVELDSVLLNEGRYVHSEGDGTWWIPSGRMFFSPGSTDTAAQELPHARQHFFLPHRYRDPFHTSAVSTESFVSYDPHDLLTVETRDALDNVASVATADDAGSTAIRIDYRVLRPYWMTDPNGNRAAVAFDALGMVVGTAVMGKPLPAPVEGDSLDGFEADLTEAVILDHLADPLDDPHAILGRATTRLVYDLFAYQRTKNQPHPQPAAVYTLARETHDSDPVAAGGLKIQHNFSYSDGFGREIQKKIRAERGPVPMRDANGEIIVGPDGQPEMTPNDVSPRWVGSGWTVFNNKGKPVRQYEPFFTDTHRFEFDVRIGVSPVLFYDPVERVIAILHPNHTWEKVVVDPWRQEAWDVSDTVLVADPKTDLDVGDFFRRLTDADYLPTWYTRRQGGALGPQEQAAAGKAAIHAQTPSVAHADSLGRSFLTVAHNKFKFSNTPPADPPIEEFHRTRVIFDIEGNHREVIDAKDRVVMRYDYDMLGTRIHQASMEAGERWMLGDVAGQPIRAWDSRGHALRTEYDVLRRPLRSFVQGADPEHPATEILFGKTEYGEGHPNDLQLNLRTKPFHQSDSAGLATSEAYDFKGNLLRASHRLAQNYKTIPDWTANPGLEQEIFTSRTSYDTLNRPVQLIAPRSNQPGAKRNIIQPVYNEASLLERVDVWLDRPTEPAGLLDAATLPSSPVGVNNIDYDAKGQRLRIGYKNGATTRYAYDSETFRLIHLYTRRGATFTADCENPDPPPATIAAPDVPPPDESCGLQNLHYTYDPVGNITHIRDDAQRTIYFNNQVVTPDNDYTYDAIYRLINAKGREHIGQLGKPETTWNDESRVNLQHPQDGTAMRNYTERYHYDAVGNFEHLIHQFADGGWTRDYAYNQASLIELGKRSNRLSTTKIGQTTEHYSYDAHGNMTAMPHLTLMRCDFRDQLSATARQLVNNGTPETTYYVYDAAGQRVRKVTERQNGTRKSERTYLGGFEVFREYDGSGTSVTLDRETLHVMDDKQVYHAAGQRVRKINERQNGTRKSESERTYLSGFEMYREYGGNGNSGTLEREALHVMDDKQRIALVEMRTHGDDGTPAQLIRYQFGNHLGSASLELNDVGQIISYEEYYPYGGTSYQAVRRQTETPKRYRYTGMERDDESGLNYHGARYYAAWLGRWVSADPIGIKGDINVYVYSSNNSIQFLDRSGKDKEGIFSIGDPEKTKTKIKIWGGALVSEPIKESEGSGHIGIVELSVKYDPSKGKVEVNVGVLDIDVNAHVAGPTSIIVSGKAGKLKGSFSGKGITVDAAAYETGVGAKVGPVKGKILFGLSAGFGYENGKFRVKFNVGIGGEVEIDAKALGKVLLDLVPESTKKNVKKSVANAAEGAATTIRHGVTGTTYMDDMYRKMYEGTTGGNYDRDRP